MIKSCLECTNKCCFVGPGPYEALPAEEYLENFGTTESYNTKCESLGDDGLCKLWGTPDFPQECRTYVCQTREYSEAEMRHIDAFDEERECDMCGSNLIYCKEVAEKDIEEININDKWTFVCEACGHEEEWTLTKRKEGKI